MVIDYISWWYTRGIVKLLKYLKAYVIILADTFSLRIVITTFFSPWKRDARPTSKLSLDQRFRIWGFNLIARCFGMVIKFFTLIVFLVLFVILVILEILIFIIWLLLPLLIIEALVLGVFYLLKI